MAKRRAGLILVLLLALGGPQRVPTVVAEPEVTPQPPVAFVPVVLPTPEPTPTPTPEPTAEPTPSPTPEVWTLDPEVSFYGPGLYGNRTACGQVLTLDTPGVAHKTLPCGTRVAFRWNGIVTEVTVIDRGPYVRGRTWDLTGATCTVLRRCWTGPIEVRLLP